MLRGRTREADRNEAEAQQFGTQGWTVRVFRRGVSATCDVQECIAVLLTKFPVHSTCWILPGTYASEQDKCKRVSIPQQADSRGFAAAVAAAVKTAVSTVAILTTLCRACVK